ncbi:radical SAM protein [Cereibacter changlensis]|uniref:Radical SAM protein n=1 Tax=Cereibacter changlensis TaxID=402884 RepID=A0A4V5NL66_9RHOB|nr:radical SAM protein [Cereibacter changlensis]
MIPVGERELEQARALLAGQGDLGASLAAASRPLAHLHDRRGAQVEGLRLLGSPDAFAAATRRALPGVDRTSVEALWSVIAASPELAAGFEVVLLRALDPLAGLLTYDDGVLFRAAEREAIASLEPPPAETPPLRGAVTGIVKITRICNLRCTYCHDWRTGPDATMDFTTLAAAMRWLIQGSNARRVNVVLHGGEPSLIGPRGLVTLLGLQARFRREGQEVVTRMQTNGARLAPALLDVLVRFDVVTSVSMDGPPEVHDLTRRTTRQAGSSDAVRRSVARLRAAGILNGVLIVVTPELIASGACSRNSRTTAAAAAARRARVPGGHRGRRG